MTQEVSAIPPRLREVLPGALLVGLTVLAGFWELWWRGFVFVDPALDLLILGSAAAVGLSRLRPGVALGLIWLIGTAQLVTGTPVLLIEAVALAVLYGTARWGTTVTMALGGASVPAAVVIGSLAVLVGSFRPDLGVLGLAVYGAPDYRQGLAVLVLLTAVLGAAWAVGLAFRFQDRAARSRVQQVEAEREAELAHGQTAQAFEIANLRSEQARLARDVHDVVGHSLAVILAQAESAQYLPDDDPARLKETLAAVATTARSSLRDIQQVLAAEPAPPGQLQTLIDGAGSTGRPVDATVHGTPRPLPPELAAVAYRVLQEMLTNAIKHGDRAVPVTVEQFWPEAEGPLVLRVGNGVVVGIPDEPDPADPGGGTGVDGMRRRLAAVGGVLKIEAGTGEHPGTHTVTAWVPVRS